MIKLIKQYRWTLVLLLMIGGLSLIDIDYGKSALSITWQNLVTIAGVLPPIFLLIGLLDVWVPKETMIRYMGDESGMKGLFFAFLLGAMAAGPLYVAFPIAALLLKKGARLAYVIFFLGTWMTAKIPLFLFEMTSLGVKFTLIHVSTMLVLYLIGALIIEKLINADEKALIVSRVSALT
ncbi:MAG: permease [Vallitaleaceae bacterium]|nr:permease [Vallitaleaceae bacterium]